VVHKSACNNSYFIVTADRITDTPSQRPKQKAAPVLKQLFVYYGILNQAVITAGLTKPYFIS